MAQSLPCTLRIPVACQGATAICPTKKKAPGAKHRGPFESMSRNGSAATAGTATAAAATTPTTTYRNPGGDGETGAHAAIDEVDLDGAAVLHQFIVNQEGQPPFLYLEIAIFWLIQSQAQ